ncbi:hydantoinase B/oxoprolinase family protein, partial [Chloroflexota bacterium]
GSRVVTEVKEHVENLFTAKGELVQCGTGVLLHTSDGMWGIPQIMRRYEGEIEEDDQFFINDPYECTLHTADQWICAPIHYKGELIAWIGALTHTLETGGIEPGGVCPSAKERCHEGINSPGVKIVRGGELNRDVYDLILNMVRVPGLVGLDLKAKIAACNDFKIRFLEVVEKYGKETVLNFMGDMINSVEYRAVKKLESLPDGKFCSRGQITDGHTDRIYTVSCTMVKKGGKLKFHIDADPPSPTSVNATERSSIGVIFACLAVHLFPELPPNAGVLKTGEFDFKRPSIVACARENATSMSILGPLHLLYGLASECVSYLLRCGTPESGISKYGGFFQNPTTIAGMTEKGYHIEQCSDLMAAGISANWQHDGCHTGGQETSARSQVANTEQMETDHPILILSRHEVEDSGGAGKFRGGMGISRLVVLHPNCPVDEHLMATGTLGLPNLGGATGLFGAYHSPTFESLIVRNTNIYDLLKKGKMPVYYTDLDGQIELLGDKAVTSFRKGDVYYATEGGGAGYGDPLDRDPEAVLGDVKEGCVTSEFAEKVYGVVIDAINMTVDVKKTEEFRKDLAQMRLQKKQVWVESGYAAKTYTSRGAFSPMMRRYKLNGGE